MGAKAILLKNEGCACNPRPQETQEGELIQVRGQPWLHEEFQDSLGYISRLITKQSVTED